MHLKNQIELTLPEVELKYKWNIPCFYIGKSPICYLNASHKKQFVDIAFSEISTFVTLRYATLEEIDNNILTDVLKDAYSVRQNGFYKREDLR